ncbi:hypothetical protein KIN20_010922 [Parelaphostrongylus tenuis]|uniref:Uncharacterized protein n=1 Tax=Parelaphostrongylus tenuis TaxID=148309 RepID=A0AAD5MZN8_PARTN|nr:hypothetical protein KIN20_010922 [Parelaphostrongylus tenuis]
MKDRHVWDMIVVGLIPIGTTQNLTVCKCLKSSLDDNPDVVCTDLVQRDRDFRRRNGTVQGIL